MISKNVKEGLFFASDFLKLEKIAKPKRYAFYVKEGKVIFY